MKTLFFNITALLLLFSSCDKEDETQTCDQNPLENIAWLKELVDAENSTDDTSGLEIIQYTYNDNTVFSVNDCINNCSDAMTVVYDCDKKVLCEFGGIAGINTCPDFESEAIFEEILFSTEINDALCDKGVIISKDVYDKVVSSPIEKISIEGNCMYITFNLLSTQDPIKDVVLVDSGAILESFPVQRNLKFVVAESLTKPTSISATTSFDISTLATWDEPKVILNIEGYAEQITYVRIAECGDPNVSCIPVQEIDTKKLAYMLEEIKAIAAVETCENPEDWKITAIGSKACGGPQSFLAYANKIDEADFLAKVEAYKIAEENYNNRWGIVSTCEITPMPSDVVCVNGIPEYVYN